jgi:deoxycytidine triphosphate deaminase
MNTFILDEKEWYWFDPGVPYLLQSVETVKLPPGIEAKVCTRTSMFRGGGSMDREWVPYGFHGKLIVQYTIPHKGLPHRIQKNAYVMALKFFWVDDGDVLNPGVFDINVDSEEILDGYEGVWKRDRVTTKGKKERGS